MARSKSPVEITRWSGGQHPTLSTITQRMKTEGLRPYMWSNKANHRYAVRSHGFAKVLFVVDGSAELILPDTNQRIRLRAGDRADIPAGVRHGTNVGSTGVRCMEATTSGSGTARTR